MLCSRERAPATVLRCLSLPSSLPRSSPDWCRPSAPADLLRTDFCHVMGASSAQHLPSLPDEGSVEKPHGAKSALAGVRAADCRWVHSPQLAKRHKITCMLLFWGNLCLCLISRSLGSRLGVFEFHLVRPPAHFWRSLGAGIATLCADNLERVAESDGVSGHHCSGPDIMSVSAEDAPQRTRLIGQAFHINSSRRPSMGVGLHLAPISDLQQLLTPLLPLTALPPRTNPPIAPESQSALVET